MLGWFRWLCELRPPIGNHTREQRLLCLRRLLDDLAAQGHPAPARSHHSAKIFPARPGIPPQSLCPRKMIIASKRNCDATDDLYSNALLLTRLTGIRIGECIHLPLDCLRQIGPEQWALHVPLGKLHTERLVPLDSEGLRLLERIHELRAHGFAWLVWRNPKASSCLAWAAGLRCFKRCASRWLISPSERAVPTRSPISPHRLRHTWASEHAPLRN